MDSLSWSCNGLLSPAAGLDDREKEREVSAISQHVCRLYIYRKPFIHASPYFVVNSVTWSFLEENISHFVPLNNQLDFQKEKKVKKYL